MNGKEKGQKESTFKPLEKIRKKLEMTSEETLLALSLLEQDEDIDMFMGSVGGLLQTIYSMEKSIKKTRKEVLASIQREKEARRREDAKT